MNPSGIGGLCMQDVRPCKLLGGVTLSACKLPLDLCVRVRVAAHSEASADAASAPPYGSMTWWEGPILVEPLRADKCRTFPSESTGPCFGPHVLRGPVTRVAGI